MLGRFGAKGQCSICRSCSLASGWHNINTHEFRCRKCFDAEERHYGSEDDAAFSAASARLGKEIEAALECGEFEAGQKATQRLTRKLASEMQRKFGDGPWTRESE